LRMKALLAVAALLSFIASSGAVSCQSAQQSFSGKTEALTIGSAPLESSALVYIAEDQKFFAENGLDVTIRGYDTGAAAFNGMLKQEVDISIPAEYPLVGAAFKGEKVRAIASIAESQYFSVVGRKDRGVQTIADLKGKRIGVVQKTIAEFYLGRFLLLHGISPADVTMVNTNLADSEVAIMGGGLDAIVIRPPQLSSVEQRLGPNGVSWPAQSSQALYAIMIGRTDWISAHPDVVKRLLKALSRAEKFAIERPGDAQAIVQKRLSLDDTHMATVWSQNQFSLQLDQSLILAMEDEARWMIANGLTHEIHVPNYTDYICEDALKTVKPEAVKIIR